MQVTDYANEVTGTLRSALGPAAPTAGLMSLTAAARHFRAAQTQAASGAGHCHLGTARDQLTSHIKDSCWPGPGHPGPRQPAPGRLGTLPDGLHGDLDIGPLHLAFVPAR